MIAVTRQIFMVVVMVTVFGTGLSVEGQIKGAGESSTQTANIVGRLETRTAQFKKSLADAFAGSRLKGSALEEIFMARVAVFTLATGVLRDRAENDEISISDVESVLRQGLYLEVMMHTHRTSPRAFRDWKDVKSSLDKLALSHNIAWGWGVNENPKWGNISVRRVFDRLEKRSDEFRSGFDDALDASRLNGTETENAANDLVEKFEETVDRLGQRVNQSGDPTRTDVAKLLVRAIIIDKFMRDHAFPPKVRRDWSRIKANLDELALRDNIVWRWVSPPVIPLARSRFDQSSSKLVFDKF